MGSDASGKAALKAQVSAEIDKRADEIVDLGDQVLHNAEPGFREVKTAKLVAERFERMGLEYRSGLALTGVKARMPGGAPGPTVAIIGELDSLIVENHPFADPVTHAAHACGHHAQIAAMVGAGLGLQSVMEDLGGDVVLFATPAEECIQLEWRLGLRQEKKLGFVIGKPELIRLGEFDDVDMAMMTHTPAWEREALASVGDTHNGGLIKYARFEGTGAHAAGAPWKGVNALKAAMLASEAIDAQRDTFRDEDYVRVQFIVTEGGEAASAVPRIARMEGILRARTIEAMQDANYKVDRALKAAAMAFGARVKITTLSAYLPNRQDPNLVRIHADNCAALVGRQNMGAPSHRSGAADLGDLSFVMPVLHPHSGGVKGSTHSDEYQVVDSQVAMIVPAKAMPFTVIDLLWDGARQARAVTQEAGRKLTREEYVALRSRFDYEEEYGEREQRVRA